MECKKCKTENKENYKFCVNCGKELQQIEKENKKVIEKSKSNYSKLIMNSLNDIKYYLLNPLDSLNNESKCDIKSVSIVGMIICLFMVIINLLKTMISVVRVTEFDWLKGNVYVWNFGNLKNLDYFSLIFKNFFIYMVIILALSFIFYVGTLIIKKEVKYEKIVLISLISIIPFVLGNMIISSLVGLLFVNAGILFLIISLVYTVSLFIILINEELKLKGYQKLFFNVICFSIIICFSYFGVVNINLLNLI